MAASTPQEAREAIVHAFSEDPDALAGIATLRGLTGCVFYALPDLGTGRNPTWDEIGSPARPALRPADRERPLRVRRPAGADETVEADVCIVGSGAGGGVIAGELAAAGKSVVVLEAGDYFDDADFDGLELNAYERSYLNGGPFPTVEGQVSIVTGTGVGGGTVVNWTNCLRTYDHVRAEWAGEHGLSDLAESDFDRHLDAVFERLEVNDECSDLNGPHQRMREGCEKLGYEFELITRNANRDRYTPRPPPTWASATRRGRRTRPRRPTSSTPGRRRGDLRRRRRRARDRRGRARRGRRGGVERPRPPGRERSRLADAHGAGAGRRRRGGLDQLAGAAASLGDRRAGGRRLPPPPPDGRRDGVLRRAAELDVGPAAGRRSRISSPTPATATGS